MIQYLSRVSIVVLLAGIFLLLADQVFAAFISPSIGSSLSLTDMFTLWGGNILFLLPWAPVSLLLGVSSTFLAGKLGDRISQFSIFGLSLGLIAFFFFYWVGKELSSGDWISQKSYAWVFIWAPALFGAATITVVSRAAFTFFKNYLSKPKTTWVVLALSVATSLCFTIANGALFFNIYYRFHMALYFLSSMFAFLGATLLVEILLAKRAQKLSILFSLVSIAGFALGISLWLTIDRPTRSNLIINAGTSSDFIRTFAPHSEQQSLLHDALLHIQSERVTTDHYGDKNKTQTYVQAQSDWNIVLISVDAARSDVLPPGRKKDTVIAKASDTPFYNKWVKDTYRFTRVYAQATCTTRSIPPLFRSLQAYEDVKKIGTPLAVTMKSLGKKPIAVVTDLFLEDRREQLSDLMNGFEIVDIYKEDAMDEQVPLTLKALDAVKDQPFFGWFHFFNLHHPGYAEGHLLTKKDGPGPLRHRKTLKWFDKEFEKMIKGFDERGLTSKTIFIIASDHGQGAGNSRSSGHGDSVWEEFIRVPLAIKIPGHTGAIIESSVVGNIDIVPTMIDLLGAPPNPMHRGHSLVPLLENPDTSWHYDYYFRSRHNDIIGLVKGNQKIIHDVEGDSIYRFNLETDPGEDHNLFFQDGDIDQAMLRRVLYHSPLRFADDLKNKPTQQLLIKLLKNIDIEKPSEELGFLLRIASFDPTQEAQTEGLRIFSNSTNRQIKLMTLKQHFHTDPKIWGKVLKQHVTRLIKTGEERTFIEALARQGQVRFAPNMISAHMKSLAKQGDLKAWKPWLNLTKNWEKKSTTVFLDAYAPMLQKILDNLSLSNQDKDVEGVRLNAEIAALIFQNISTFNRRKLKSKRQVLLESIKPFLSLPYPSLKVSTIRSLGVVCGEQESRDLLRSAFELSRKDIQLHQLFFRAIIQAEGKSAMTFALSQSDNPFLMLDIIKMLKRFRAKEGLPFLKKLSKEHPDFYIRKTAEHAIKRIKPS